MEQKDEKTVLANSGKSEKTILNDIADNRMNNGIGKDVQSEISNQTNGKKVTWKEVAISGASGAVMGSAAILLTGFTLPPDIINTDNHGSADNNEHEGHDIVSGDAQIDVATCVNDDMSFGEAFAAARHEVGANGAFVWHGQVYTTCYAEEWNALSEEEQSQFSSNAIAAVTGDDSQSTDNGNQDSDGETQNSEVEAQIVEGEVQNTEGEVQNAEGEVQNTEGEVQNSEVINSEEEIEVSILGVEENVVTEDGEIINVGYADVEGHSAIFIDADADGTFDIVAADINDDGYIDINNEVGEVGYADLNVQDFQAAIEPDPIDDLYAQTPDYTNDADPSSFA